jgi:excisionase family DNA binding protein
MQVKYRAGKPADEMLTIGEVASWLRVHPVTIRRWEKQNHLKSYRIGPKKSIRFIRKDVADFIAHSNRYRTKHGLPDTKGS